MSAMTSNGVMPSVSTIARMAVTRSTLVGKMLAVSAYATVSAWMGVTVLRTLVMRELHRSMVSAAWSVVNGRSVMSGMPMATMRSTVMGELLAVRAMSLAVRVLAVAVFATPLGHRSSAFLSAAPGVALVAMLAVVLLTG